MRDLLKASTKKPNHIWGGQWTICWLIVILDSSHHTWTSAFWRHSLAALIQKHTPSKKKKKKKIRKPIKRKCLSGFQRTLTNINLKGPININENLLVLNLENLNKPAAFSICSTNSKGGPTCAQHVSFLSSVYIKTCHCLFTTSDIPHRTCSSCQLCSEPTSRYKKQIMLAWPTYFPLPYPVCVISSDGMSS